jgi:cell division protein FtsL
MINEARHWIYAIIFLVIAVVLLGLIYKISRLEEVNGELRQIKRQYEQICTRHGGNNCE